MIYDEDGDELLYWPITLKAGEDSVHLIIGIDTPQANELRATIDSRGIVYGRMAGTADPFVNLATNPIDLRAMPGGRTQFEIYLHANNPIVGLQRTPFSVGPTTSSPANWAG